jgi:hypothetical protein
MFTWICPKCGREVPPQYSECPDCEKAEQAKASGPSDPGPPIVAATPPPPVPEYRPPEPVHPTTPPPPPPSFAQPPAPTLGQAYPAYAPPLPRAGMPAWLLTIVFALAIFGVVAGVYWLVGALKGGSTAPAKQLATVESPAAKPGATTSPFQKYVEVSGVRFLEDAKKKPQVRFVLTNHSGAEMTGLSGNVTIWARTQKSEEESAGTFTFTNVSLGPWESKDLTAPLTTKLAMIELPDWQNTTTDVQITTGAQ